MKIFCFLIKLHTYKLFKSETKIRWSKLPIIHFQYPHTIGVHNKETHFTTRAQLVNIREAHQKKYMVKR